MIKYMRNAVACAFGFVALALASGCNPGTSVRVVQDGVPVAGAEVFASNRDAATGRIFHTRLGLTDASGVLALPSGVALNTALVARKLKFERPGWRPHHNPDGGADHEGVSWTERVYITSMDVVDEPGVLRPLFVTAPAAQQTLELRSDRALIGFHFLVSVVWDASDAELEQIGEKFRQAGDYLYNASDGQFYFEQVDIVDDGTFWGDADYRWHSALGQWPNCWSLRGLFVPNVFGSAVEMSRRTDQSLSDPSVIAHEFGHLGFGVMDEYMPGIAFCAAHLRDTPSDPSFGPNMPRASCVMFNEWEATKYCSNHHDNPHNTGSLEADNCWHAIASALADTTNTPAQWTIQTPDTRGFIVGMLPPNSSARWQPGIVIDNKVSTLGLPCQPFNLTAPWPDGNTAGANFPVTLAVGSRRLHEGPTSDGLVTIVGAHAGDRIWIGEFGPWRNVVATPSVGPHICEAP
jgi:hypothetical protein